MAKRPVIKDIYLEQKIFSSRSIVMVIFVFLLTGILLYHMVRLQVLSHQYYSDLAKDNRVHFTPVPPDRGLIYDRNGVLLADNSPSYTLEVIPEQVNDLPNTLSLLAKILPISDNDFSRFEKLRRREPSFRSIPLRNNLTDEEAARFYVERHNFAGVDVRARLNRYYPLADLYAHILGYVGRISDADQKRLDEQNYRGTTHTGKSGIERYYEQALHGLVGLRQEEVNFVGRRVRVLSESPAIGGESLVLSVDSELQQVTMDALGEHNGAAVAMDPRTGEVLALVSKPSYDTNLFVNGISSKDYAKLRDDPNRPLYNRAIQGQYPPGSTVKLITAIAGLEYGKARYREPVFTPGYFQLETGGRRYRDLHRYGSGWMDMDEAITRSADVYFYDLSHRIGIDKLTAMFAQFGLGMKTGIDLPNEAAGLLPTRAWKKRRHNKPWFPGETLIVGIGQGYLLTTPVQLAAFASCLAMRGDCHRPTLLKSRISPDREEIDHQSEVHQIKLRNPSDWDDIIASMNHVIQSRKGTAYGIGKDIPYTAAGKTGTAQVFGLKEGQKYDASKLKKHLHDHAVFVAFAPVEAPEVAIGVIVEHGGSGGRVAAPVARAMMDQLLAPEVLEPLPNPDEKAAETGERESQASPGNP